MAARVCSALPQEQLTRLESDSGSQSRRRTPTEQLPLCAGHKSFVTVSAEQEKDIRNPLEHMLK